MQEEFRRQIAEHVRVVEAFALQADALEQIVGKIVASVESGGKVLVLGNGGSAADAQHIAAELVGRFKDDHKPLPAVALTTDSSILTAVGNDFGYENCFARQVEALAKSGDVVWALSVSGKSPSVLRALEIARRLGAITIGFSGRSGGDMVPLCDVIVRADHDASDRVQETHSLAYHLICDRIEQRYLR